MWSERRESLLDEQLRSFARTLEGETGEPIRPTRRPMNPGAERNADTPPGVIDMAPRRESRRRLVLFAAVAVIVVGVGSLILGANRMRGNETVLVQDTDPVPAPSLTPANTTVDAEPSATSSAPVPTAAAPTTTTTTTTSPERAPAWSGGLLAEIDRLTLLPLSSAGDGDFFVVPTAPSDWRILSGGYGGNENGFSTSTITIIEARPDGTTGPWIQLRVSRFGMCVVEQTDLSCATTGDPVEINGVVWQPFTEINGVRGISGDLLIDVRVRGLEPPGSLLDEPLIMEYLDGLRVGIGEDYWQTLRTEVGQACWACSDTGSPDEAN